MQKFHWAHTTTTGAAAIVGRRVEAADSSHRKAVFNKIGPVRESGFQIGRGHLQRKDYLGVPWDLIPSLDGD